MWIQQKTSELDHCVYISFSLERLCAILFYSTQDKWLVFYFKHNASEWWFTLSVINILCSMSLCVPQEKEHTQCRMSPLTFIVFFKFFIICPCVPLKKQIHLCKKNVVLGLYLTTELHPVSYYIKLFQKIDRFLMTPFIATPQKHTQMRWFCTVVKAISCVSKYTVFLPTLYSTVFYISGFPSSTFSVLALLLL